MNASGNARVSSSTIYVYSKTKIHIFIGFIDKKNSPIQKEHWITSRQMCVLYLVLKQHNIWTIQ